MTPRRTIDRRTWLAACLGAVAGVRTASAQKIYRIGLLGGSSPTSAEARHIWQEFFNALRDLGYVEGRNVLFEGRYYGNNLDQLPVFAAELVKLRVDLILAAAPPAPEAAKRATSTIPIVMANHADPVGSGLVASLARPRGNVTGLSMQTPEMRLKQMQLLKEILPRLSSIAYLRNPDIPLDVNEIETMARGLGIRALVVEARSPGEIAEAIATAMRGQAEALSVLTGSMFFAQRALIAELALRSRLPSVYLLREHAEAGGLLTYGVDLRDNFRQAARFVDKILRGARPGELPVEQPTKYELVINLRTAKALGLEVPRAVLARADQVIE